MKRKSAFYFFLGFVVFPVLMKSEHPVLKSMRTFILEEPVMAVILVLMIHVSLKLMGKSGFIINKKSDEADKES